MDPDSGFETDYTFLLNIALVSAIWLWQCRKCLHPLPFFFQTGSQVTKGFFPSLFQFISFFFCHSLQKFPSSVRALPFWEHCRNNNMWPVLESNRLSNEFPTAVGNSFLPAHWFIFRVTCKTSLRAAYFASCVCQDPPPVDTHHVGLKKRECSVRGKGDKGDLKDKFSPGMLLS